MYGQCNCGFKAPSEIVVPMASSSACIVPEVHWQSPCLGSARTERCYAAAQLSGIRRKTRRFSLASSPPLAVLVVLSSEHPLCGNRRLAHTRRDPATSGAIEASRVAAGIEAGRPRSNRRPIIGARARPEAARETMQTRFATALRVEATTTAARGERVCMPNTSEVTNEAVVLRFCHVTYRRPARGTDWTDLL